MVALAGGDVPTSLPEHEAMAGPPCEHVFTQAQHARFARAAYGRQKVSRKAQKRVALMRRCTPTPKAQLNAKRLTRRLRNRYLERRRIQAMTPYGGWAIPQYIVMCESKGNFRARNSSSTAGGAYQILNTTWYAHGGSRYNDSHPAACAPPSEQHKIAARIWAAGGASQWACS